MGPRGHLWGGKLVFGAWTLAWHGLHYELLMLM